MVIATVSSSPNPKLSSKGSNLYNPKRPPLLPAEEAANNAPPPRSGREVSSRYLSSPSLSSSFSSNSSSSSSISSRRSHTPIPTRRLDSNTTTRSRRLDSVTPTRGRRLDAVAPTHNLSRRLDRVMTPTHNHQSRRLDSDTPTPSRRVDSVSVAPTQNRRLDAVSVTTIQSRRIDSVTPTQSQSRRVDSVSVAPTQSQSRRIDSVTPTQSQSRRVDSVSVAPTQSQSRRIDFVTPGLSRRTQSVERRRGGMSTVGRGKEDMTNAERVLMKSSRSLSVSFQGESFKLPVSKAKPAPVLVPGSVRRGTPERRKGESVVKDQREEVKIGDQYRWPGRSKGMNSGVLMRSLDCGGDKSKLVGSGNGVRDLQNSVIKSKREDRLKSELNRKDQCADDANSGSISIKSADCGISDTDSVSSGSTLGGSVVQARGGLRGIVVPARFLQETNSRLRKEVEPAFGSPKSKNNDSRMKSSSTPTGTKKHLLETPVSLSKAGSVSGRFASPSRGETRLASISKGLFTSVNLPSPRGRPSPTRTRNGKPDISLDNGTPSVLSFPADMRIVRAGENRVNDAHELRMLYNRQLQWRFINARAEAALLLQSGTAERSLYNAWVTISKLRHSIRSKRIQLQLLRQNLKLYTILKGQTPYLESWSLIDSHHCISLSEARKALQTSIVNVPLVDGATADVQLLKHAISSATNVMQGITSSVGSHLKVEQVSLLASELKNTTATEIALVDQGKNLLSALAAMQVNECSLKTHILQLPREASSLAAQV